MPGEQRRPPIASRLAASSQRPGRSCHAIDANGARTESTAPDFVAVVDLPSTTELSLKVSLQSSHHNMPNLMLTPEQSSDIVNYMLSLKRR
jgi:cytochrome c